MIIQGSNDNQEILLAVDVLVERRRVQQVQTVNQSSFLDLFVNLFLYGVQQQKLLLVIVVKHLSGEELVEDQVLTQRLFGLLIKWFGI
jgi:hypothetical protein